MGVWESVERGQTRQGAKASTVETQTRLRGRSWPSCSGSQSVRKPTTGTEMRKVLLSPEVTWKG